MGQLVFQANLGGAVNLAGPNTASTVTFTLPSADGTNGQALVTNGSGTLSFSSFVSSAAGSNTQVQFNSGGAFGASANLTFDGTTLTSTGFSGPHNGTVGATTPNTGSFTTLTTSSTVTLSGGTANGVAYLNASKVLTTGSALTFDGTNFSAPASIITNSIGLLYGITYSAGNSQAWFTVNSTASDTYRVADTAMRYRLLTGVGHVWETAPSGSVGGAITWSEQMRLTSTGLGIGTSSPGYKLDVAGQGQFSAASTDAILKLTRTTTSTGSGWLGASSAYSFIVYSGDLTKSRQFSVAQGAPTDALTLDSSGNLGLGVTPSAWSSTWKVFQAGTSSFSNNGIQGTYLGANWRFDGTGDKYINTANASIYYQNAGQHVWLTAPSGTAGNAISFTQAMTLDASGRLLVGSTASNGDGSVEGVARTNATPGVVAGSRTSGDVASAALLVTKFDNNSTTSQVFQRFAINNNATASGQINANGASQAAFGSWSDRRLKTNIVDLPPQLANVMALRPVEFDYVESEGGGHQISFIAQEMEDVYPDVVGERDDGMKTITGWGKTEARLVKAIQEQQALINDLRVRVAQLEGK